MKFLKVLFFIFIGYILTFLDPTEFKIMLWLYIIFWIVRGIRIKKHKLEFKVEKSQLKAEEAQKIAEQNQRTNCYIHQQQAIKKELADLNLKYQMSSKPKISEIVECKCKNCNAPLVKKEGFYICEYCNSKFVIE